MGEGLEFSGVVSDEFEYTASQAAGILFSHTSQKLPLIREASGPESHIPTPASTRLNATSVVFLVVKSAAYDAIRANPTADAITDALQSERRTGGVEGRMAETGMEDDTFSSAALAPAPIWDIDMSIPLMNPIIRARHTGAISANTL